MRGGRLAKTASHPGPVAAPAPAARAVSGNLLAAGKPADVSGPMLGTAMFDVAGGATAGMLGSGPGGACAATAGTPEKTALGSVGPVAPRGSMGGTGGSDVFNLLPACQLSPHWLQ